MPPKAGIPVMLLLVPMTVPAMMFEEPTPVVPTCRSYSVTPVPAVHVKVTVAPLSVLPAAGEAIVAGTGCRTVMLAVTCAAEA